MTTETDYRLDPNRVKAVFEECHVPADTKDAVLVEGITGAEEFDFERLQANVEEIEQMLLELPDVYRESHGGGMSFTQACIDRHGNQWTGMQMVMNQLFMLGLAIGKVESLLPREMWDALPGGMPYYVIKDA